jgi:hypothetical protein
MPRRIAHAESRSWNGTFALRAAPRSVQRRAAVHPVDLIGTRLPRLDVSGRSRAESRKHELQRPRSVGRCNGSPLPPTSGAAPEGAASGVNDALAPRSPYAYVPLRLQVARRLASRASGAPLAPPQGPAKRPEHLRLSVSPTLGRLRTRVLAWRSLPVSPASAPTATSNRTMPPGASTACQKPLPT